MTEAVLTVDGLRIASREAELVRGVSFTLGAGTPLTLVGETGSGKSLIAQAIMGTLSGELAATGRVMLGDVDLLKLPLPARRALWGRRMSLLPQEPWLALDPTMRVASQVEEVFRLVHHRPRRAARDDALARLDAVGLGGVAGSYPFQLSGGMCQRVSLAIAHAADAPILLADEPTKGLDAALRDGVARDLLSEAQAGRALLTITHDLSVARMLGGEIIVLLDGRIVEQGPVEQVLARPEKPYTQALIAAAPENWPGRLPAGAGSGEPVIRGRNMSKRFGERTLFAGFDLDIRAGEIVSLVGPSGCGKTTLGNCLLGLAALSGGTVAAAEGLSSTALQKLYQDPPAAFAPRQTMRAALGDLARRHGRSPEEATPLLARLRLAPALLDRRPDQLSGGELQRFALVRILMTDAALLFADEPTSRLDPIVQKEVMDLLFEVVEERRLALILVTHDRVVAAKAGGRILELADRPASKAAA